MLLFIGFKKAYISIRRGDLYSIHSKFGIPLKLAMLINMCLTEICKHLSDVFAIRNGLKQGDALSPLLFTFALEYAIRRVQINQDGLKLNSTGFMLI
jgi:hypothetical protein